MPWWVWPWFAFSCGVITLIALLMLVDRWFERGDESMSTAVGVHRVRRILTVVGLASAGTVIGLMRLWQIDADGIDELDPADEDW